MDSLRRRDLLSPFDDPVELNEEYDHSRRHGRGEEENVRDFIDGAQGRDRGSQRGWVERMGWDDEKRLLLRP